LRYLLFVLCCILLGCVQIPDDRVGPVPAPGPVLPDSQFADVDEALKAKILASVELRDPVRLRRYAALYRGMQDVARQQDLSLMQVLQAGIKATEQFVDSRSKDMQAILQAHMPKPPLTEQDRDRVAGAFGALSKACHAAAHDLENGGA